LLETAGGSPDPVVRMAYCAAFMISTHSMYQKAIMKPFNPLLGETYELINPKFKFFAE
jgi:hypothetical protein